MIRPKLAAKSSYVHMLNNRSRSLGAVASSVSRLGASVCWHDKSNITMIPELHTKSSSTLNVVDLHDNDHPFLP